MSNINIDKVLFGTDQKLLDARYNEMMTDFSEEKASKFYETYKDKSLSFILKNAYKIIKEPYYGTSFFINLVSESFVPFHKINEILHISKEICDESSNLALPYDQKDSYIVLKNMIEKIKKTYKNTISLFEIACSKNGEEYIDTVYDYLYEIKDHGTSEEFYNLLYTIDNTCENAYVRIALIISYVILFSDVTSSLYELLTRTVTNPYGFGDENEFDYEKFQNDGKIALCLASKDEELCDAINTSTNNNFRYLWFGIATSGIQKPAYTQESSIQNIPIFSEFDLMERMVTESSNEDICKKYDFYKSLKSYYESMIEYAGDCEQFGISYDGESETKCEACINEIDAQLSFLEWTDDGEPDPTIKNHIMTRKQIQKEKDEKEQQKNKSKQEAIQKMEEDELSEEDEDDDVEKVSSSNISTRKKAVDLSFKAIRTVNGAREHVVKNEKDKFENGKSNSLCLGSFKEEDYNKVYSALKEGLKPVYDDFNVMKDNYRTIFLQVKHKSNLFIESTEGQEDDKTPVKPKEDLVTKIQNKAMDHEAKRQEKKALNEEKKIKLKNAGKAISAQPKDWEKSSKSISEKIDKWDVKRRKEFFLKPGFRHKIFRNMKHALMYGTAARTKVTMLPLLMLTRHFSKEKDRRIRNEIIRELETEIKICEEKINDANSNGDQQEKYKLMRVKEKLHAEKNRVQLNSKYI